MAMVDGNGLPISASITSVSPHEVTLIETTLEPCFAPDLPQRLIG